MTTESEDFITMTVDETVEVIEELSHRPYRNVFQMIAILSARVQEARVAEEPKVYTGDK